MARLQSWLADHPGLKNTPSCSVRSRGWWLQVARWVVAAVVPLVQGPLSDLVYALWPAVSRVLDAVRVVKDISFAREVGGHIGRER